MGSRGAQEPQVKTLKEHSARSSETMVINSQLLQGCRAQDALYGSHPTGLSPKSQFLFHGAPGKSVPSSGTLSPALLSRKGVGAGLAQAGGRGHLQQDCQC
jgi:hypothetical protein